MRIQLTSRPLFSLFAPRACALVLAACAIAFSPGVSRAQGKDSGSYGPIVAIVSPEYSDVLNGEAKIVIAIQPRRYPAQGVELLVDGKAVTKVLPPGTKFNWKTWLFVDGPHTLGVRVTDTQGFIGQAETMVYINNARQADSSAPILRWLGVENGQKLSGLAHIRVQAGDEFGVKYVLFSLNPAITPDAKPTLSSWIINRPPYDFPLDTTRYKDGMYVLDALAFDAADNERNAPRLTVSFVNSVPTAPETSAPAETPAPQNPDSNSTGNPAAPSTKENPLIAPPRATPAPQQPQPQEVAPPQSTVTTTPNGWIASVPAPTMHAAAQQTAPRITTNANAMISQPPLPPRVAPEKAPAVQSPAPAPAVSAPAVSAPVTAPTRLSKAQIADSGAAPSVTVAGSSENENSTLIAVPARSLNNERLAVAPEIRWTTPREFHQAPAKTNAGGDGAMTVSSHPSVTAPRSTPGLPSADIAPLPADSRTLQLTAPQAPASQTPAAPAGRLSNSTALLSPSSLEIGPSTRIAVIEPKRERETRSVFSAIAGLPTPSVKNAPAPSKPDATRLANNILPNSTAKTNASVARATSVSQNPNTRIAFVAPLATSRIAGAGSTPNLPTAPRLAFSPNLKQSEAPDRSNAAIVISPATDVPTVHVAQNNETLAAIAARYKMPISALAAANHLETNATVAKGAKIALPQALLISYHGQAVTGDVAPLLIGSTSVAPFRFLFEKQGGTMTWDAASQRVTASNGKYEISLEIGSDKAIVNQEEVMMDMAAFLLSGRTMVPVRFFEKALQAKVEWEPSTGRIFVAMTP